MAAACSGSVGRRLAPRADAVCSDIGVTRAPASHQALYAHAPQARRRPRLALRAGAALAGILDDLPPVRRELTRYYASLARMDDSLGAVLDVLDATGNAGDTVVVSLSVNGMSVHVREGDGLPPR